MNYCYLQRRDCDFRHTFSRPIVWVNNSRLIMDLNLNPFGLLHQNIFWLMLCYLMLMLIHQMHNNLYLSDCIDCRMFFHQMSCNETLIHVNILCKVLCSWWCAVYQIQKSFMNDIECSKLSDNLLRFKKIQSSLK